MNQDLEHLRLLSIFHYVVAGLAALFACFPMIHLAIGLVMLLWPDVLFQDRNVDFPESERQMLGLMFTVIASLFILAGWAMALCTFFAGRNLGRHRHYTYCLVMAGILCMFVPFGTVLGVFTIIVLIRPSVKTLFKGS